MTSAPSQAKTRCCYTSKLSFLFELSRKGRAFNKSKEKVWAEEEVYFTMFSLPLLDES